MARFSYIHNTLYYKLYYKVLQNLTKPTSKHLNEIILIYLAKIFHLFTFLF